MLDALDEHRLMALPELAQRHVREVLDDAPAAEDDDLPVGLVGHPVGEQATRNVLPQPRRGAVGGPDGAGPTGPAMISAL